VVHGLHLYALGMHAYIENLCACMVQGTEKNT
jgi:hypothetical protein